MTNWQWDVILDLCRAAKTLAGQTNNLDYIDFTLIDEALLRNEQYKEEYTQKDETAKAIEGMIAGLFGGQHTPGGSK